MTAPDFVPHPSTATTVLSFGKYKGKTVQEMLASPDSLGYLRWLAGMRDFFDPYWPEAAAKALAGEELPARPVRQKERADHRQSAVVPSIPSILGRASITVVADGYLGIQFPKNDDLAKAFKDGVDGRWWNPTDRRWEAPIAQIRRVVEVLGGERAVVMDDATRTAYELEVHRRAQLDGLRLKLTGSLVIKGLLLDLWGYQLSAVEFAQVAGFRCIFAHDVGLGKTPMGIGVALHTQSKTLVVCPAAVKIGWQRKVKLFAGLESTVWEGDKVRGDLDNQFHIVGYEIFVKRKAELQALGFALLLVDECHSFANQKSLRSLALFGGTEKRKDANKRQIRVKHARFVTPYCVMLTATAINNHPRELFPLLNYLAPDRFPNFYEYGMRYGAFPVGNLSGLPSKPMNLGDLHQRIGDIVLRVLEDDVQNDRPKALPPHDLWVELDPKKRREYRKLLDTLVADWEQGGKPTLASMHVLREWLNRVKLDRVWELLDSLINAGKSVVLFSTRLEPLEATLARYGDTAVLITGDMTLKARQRSIDAFSEKRAKVACISIRAGGTGIDGLQYGGHHVVFLDQDWVPALHHQAKGRLDRTGQTHSVVTYYAMVENTVDEYLREILDRKLALANEIMDGKTLKLKRRKSVFKEFVQRLKKDYKALDALEADENEGAADEHLEAA